MVLQSAIARAILCALAMSDGRPNGPGRATGTSSETMRPLGLGFNGCDIAGVPPL